MIVAQLVLTVTAVKKMIREWKCVIKPVVENVIYVKRKCKIQLAQL
jgi:hypothetical protein